MYQFIHLRKASFHVPSIVSASIRPTFFLRRPIICVQYQIGTRKKIKYLPTEWKQAQKDFLLLQDSIYACSSVLEFVPRLQDPLVEQK